MNFAEVTDVVIPQGSVTKIAETSTGRVLWEKGLPIPTAHWEIIDLPTQDNNGEAYGYLLTCVDTGDGIEIFTRNGRHFKYNADGTVGNISSFQDVTTTYCADIDPVSKKWLVFGSKRYASNDFSGMKELDKAKYMCCWSPQLECFCAISNNDAVMINLNGEIQGISQEVPFSDLNVIRRYESLIWADSLNKFVIPDMTMGRRNIHFSSDGLNWEAKKIKFIGNFPDLPAEGDMNIILLYQIRWMPTVKKYIGFVDINTITDTSYKNCYAIMSTDCSNWEYVPVSFKSSSIVKFAYSPDKKVMALARQNSSYVTRDLENWVAVPYIEGITQGEARTMKWSKSLNGFIRIANENIPRFYKLVIDN